MRYLVLFLALFLTACGVSQRVTGFKAERLPENPIITAPMFPGDDGANINGPSLVKVPDFVENPLGNYYLYFAHHNGKYIRMAYADAVEGPYTIYEPGTLRLEDCICDRVKPGDPYVPHIASPEVEIDEAEKKFVMYFHCPQYLGGDRKFKQNFAQLTLRSTSDNGIDFVPESEPLGVSYFRVFPWNGYQYAIARLGQLYRSTDGISDFEKGPNPFLKVAGDKQVRHNDIYLEDDTLWVFYTQIGDAPENMLVSKIRLTENWEDWKVEAPKVVLRPETSYEGIDLETLPSKRGAIFEPVKQFRDPNVFNDGGTLYLLYAVEGETAIAISKLKKE